MLLKTEPPSDNQASRDINSFHVIIQLKKKPAALMHAVIN
jgi:hypothetical protein